MRLVWFFFYSFLIFTFFSILSFLLLGDGEFVGIGLFCIASILILFFGDKCFLFFIKSKKLDDRSLIVQKVKNIVYRKSFCPVDLYTSLEFEGDILIVETLSGHPKLVLGRGIEGHLNDDQLELLLTLALRKIENRDSLFNSFFVFAIMLFIVPLYLLGWEKIRHALLLMLMTFLRPFFFLHKKISQKFDYGPQHLAHDDHMDVRPLNIFWQKSKGMNPHYLKQSLMELVAIIKGKNDFLIDSLLRY